MMVDDSIALLRKMKIIHDQAEQSRIAQREADLREQEKNKSALIDRIFLDIIQDFERLVKDSARAEVTSATLAVLTESEEVSVADEVVYKLREKYPFFTFYSASEHSETHPFTAIYTAWDYSILNHY